jgi:hypothetical protein
VADPAELALRLHDALEEARLPHAIGGAIAFGFHAEPRATANVDLNVFVGDGRLPELLSVLEKARVRIDRVEAAGSVAERGDLTGRAEGCRVDVFVSFHPFHESVRSRVQAGSLFGKRIPILSPEDLVVFTVLFARPKDWLDIQSLAAARELDRAYLRRWIDELLSEGDPRRDRLEGALSGEVQDDSPLFSMLDSWRRFG